MSYRLFVVFRKVGSGIRRLPNSGTGTVARKSGTTKKKRTNMGNFHNIDVPGSHDILYLDTAGELWWIDKDGDLFVWEGDDLPATPYEVRRVGVDMQKGADADVQLAIDESVKVEDFNWDDYLAGWGHFREEDGQDVETFVQRAADVLADSWEEFSGKEFSEDRFEDLVEVLSNFFAEENESED
jgi:hypothetical protein